MKHIVIFRAADEKASHVQEFDSLEAVIAFIQMIRFPKNGGIYPTSNIKIIPAIPEKSLVFNKETYETRIVKSLDYTSGEAEVYDTDSYEDLKIRGESCTKNEKWKIQDCEVLDPKSLKRHGFYFKNELGKKK